MLHEIRPGQSTSLKLTSNITMIMKNIINHEGKPFNGKPQFQYDLFDTDSPQRLKSFPRL
jgi:hypothetical protein